MSRILQNERDTSAGVPFQGLQGAGDIPLNGNSVIKSYQV